MTSNPYTPPKETASLPSSGRDDRTDFRRGPAWYISFAGLAGGFASIPFLARQDAVGFVFVLMGCVIGGFLYRVRSRYWPIDPMVPRRQIIYSALAIVLLPTMLFLLAGSNGQGFVFIGAIVGGSVACGIFASGTRRYRAARDVDPDASEWRQ